MKKVLALLIAAVMIFALCACGQQAAPAATQAPQEQPTEKTEQPPAEPAQTEEAVKEIDWPKAPITLIVSGSAGGGIDNQARVYAKYLEQALGVSVVVQNESNTSAYQSLRSAQPDGYTYLFTSAAYFIQDGMGSLGYTFDEGCEAATVFSTSRTNGLYARADGKYKTFEEFAQAVKANPGDVQVGIAAATYFHVFPAALEQALGLDYDMIDAGTDNERTLSLVGGQIDVIASQYSNAIRPYVESGEVICLGIAQDERNPALPDVPTLKELGYDFTFPGQLMVVVGPKGVDEAILNKLSGAVNSFLESEDFLADVANLGVEAYGPMSHAETDALMRELRDTFVDATALILGE